MEKYKYKLHGNFDIHATVEASTLNEALVKIYQLKQFPLMVKWRCFQAAVLKTIHGGEFIISWEPV